MDDMVRCPSCGDPASVWAPSCPACGADLSGAQLIEFAPRAPSATAPPGPDAPPVPDAPSPAQRVARRRRETMGAALVIAIAAVTAALLVMVEGTASTPGWSGTLSARAVVAIHDGFVYRYSPQGSAPVSKDFAHRVPRITSGPIQVSGEAVVAGGGMAFAFDGPHALDLGPADTIMANVGGTAVWLIRTPSRAPATVTLVAVTGDNEETTARLPPDTTVLADAGQGLLVRQGDQPPMVLVPATGAILYRFPVSFRDLVATGDPYEPHVAWRDTDCVNGDLCTLHLTNLATRTDQVLSAPPGYQGFLPGGAFSPDDTPLAFDDTILAAFLADPHRGGRTQIELITTPNPPNYVLSADLPTPVPGTSRSAQWAPPGAPEGLFIAEGKHMVVLDSQAHLTTIPVPTPAQYAVL